MVQPQNLLFPIILMVVLRGTAAPVLFKWFLNRDVTIGAPFYNGTIIPLSTPLSILSGYIHYRGFIRSMDGAGKVVLVRARPLQLPSIIGKSSSSGTRAKDAFFPSSFSPHSTIPKSMGDLSDLESLCGVLRFLLFCIISLPPGVNERLTRAQKVKRQMLRPHGQQRNEEINAEGYPGHTTGRSREIANHPFSKHNQGWVGKNLSLGSPREQSFFLAATQFPKTGKRITLTPSLGRGGGKGSRVWYPPGLKDAKRWMQRKIVFFSNKGKIQFTQLLPLGSELHIGRERRCLRGIDQLHGPTPHSICGNLIIHKPSLAKPVRHPLPIPDASSVRNPAASSVPTPLDLLRERDPRDPSLLPGGPFVFKHDGSLRAIIDLLPIHFEADSVKLNTLGSWINHEHNSCFPLWWTMFPEKRFSFSNQETSTTKVAIHTNPFTDPYALMGTGSFETGWYTTIMKPPSISCIRIGFLLASLGGLRSLLRQLALDKSNRNQE
uniref:Cytochrome c biogenesis FC n=1 Tax=Psilotum nudum TaxID=3240 RepID=A0A1B3TRM1_PSINU|nr:cytochrome c biogenesis FC [Psilotum nudum]